MHINNVITCACLTISFFPCLMSRWDSFIIIIVPLNWSVSWWLQNFGIQCNDECPHFWQHADRKNIINNKGSIRFPMRDCKPCPFLLINVYHIFHHQLFSEEKVAECAHTNVRTHKQQQKTKEWESPEIFIIIISCGSFCADDIFHHLIYWLFATLCLIVSPSFSV